MIYSNSSLLTLDLVNTAIKTDGLAIIIEALINSDCVIERLYLSGNNFNSNDAYLLADLLKNNTKIKYLFVGTNHLQDKGAVILSEALRQNKTLKELGLNSNNIGDLGSISILKAIESNPNITSLNFGYSPSTKVLQAEGNKISDRGAKVIGEFLTNNQTLQRLDLRKNHLTEIGIEHLLVGLQHNNSLTKLLLDGKPYRKIDSILYHNQKINSSSKTVSDITLIRSVYR